MLLAIEALTIVAWQTATTIRQMQIGKHTQSIFVAYMVVSFWRITTCNECVYSHRMNVLIPHGHYQLDIYGCAAAALMDTEALQIEVQTDRDTRTKVVSKLSGEKARRAAVRPKHK